MRDKQPLSHLVWEYMEHVVLSSAAAGTAVREYKDKGQRPNRSWAPSARRSPDPLRDLETSRS